MTLLKVCDLKIHPDNEYYFDDISGEKWKKLLESIKNNGVRTPIIVTDDMRVVSGNQRVRACKELGIEMINAEVAHYKSEEDIIRDLIEINIRQRGVIDDSEIKIGRRMKFLERYYGVEHGNNQFSNPNNSESSKTQKQLADESNMSVDTMQNYIKLAEMIPQMQELVETGIVSKTTALAIVKRLPEFQQKELAEQLSADDKKKSQREVQQYIDMIAEKDRKIKELESREPEVKTVVKEVVPDDYEDLKEQAKMADIHKKDFQYMRKAYDEMADKWKKSESEKQKLIDKAKKPEEENEERLKISAFSFCSGMSNFLEKYGGYEYLMSEIDVLPDNQRKAVYDGIRAIYRWADEMLNVGVTEVIE